MAEAQDLREALVVETGLDALPDEALDSFLAAAREELQQRVGRRLAGVLTESQMEEFGEIFDARDDERAVKFLAENVPEYPEVVRSEIARLRDEVRARASEIVRAAAERSD